MVARHFRRQRDHSGRRWLTTGPEVMSEEKGPDLGGAGEPCELRIEITHETNNPTENAGKTALYTVYR